MAEVKTKTGLKTVDLPVDDLRPNPWNPNRMDERTLQATKESLATYGFVEPTLVRPHPDEEGAYQIINGEHRWKVAPDLGYQVIPCVVATLSDTAARKLTIVLNETRGEPDDHLLGTLLAELQKEEGEGLRNALRYNDAEVDHLLALATAEVPDYEPEDTDQTDDAVKWAMFSARIPRDFLPVLEQCEEKVREILEADGKDLHHMKLVRAGQVLEVLAAEYLAGP